MIQAVTSQHIGIFNMVTSFLSSASCFRKKGYMNANAKAVTKGAVFRTCILVAFNNIM